jgi:hypothetical protein
VGEAMTSAELTEWMAYERVYGSVLAHERIDVGFAMLGTLVHNLWSKKPRKIQDFMPSWFQELIGRTERRPEAVLQGFEALMRMAEGDK